MVNTNFLVLVDDSEEMLVALKFACLRANSIGGKVTLAHIVEPSSGGENWLSISSIAQQEGLKDAKSLLKQHVENVEKITGITPDTIIRKGTVAEEFINMINEEKTISIAVLAASANSSNPGPVINSLMSKGIGSFHVPITIVPGSITDSELESIA